MTEVVIIAAVGSLVAVTAVSYSVPWLARESMRSAVYDVQSFLQLAKMEAVSRNRVCRFVVDTGTRQLQVWDSMGTASTSDDELIESGRLPSSISFARPDSGSAVTLPQEAGSRHQALFDSEGRVSGNAGQVAIFGGSRYSRLQLFQAGGLQVERWDGQSWQKGL